jgi:hypothetical protein
LNFAFVRSYRSSLADRGGELGRGWSASLAARAYRIGRAVLRQIATVATPDTLLRGIAS